MTVQPKATIKSYFESGDRPTQGEFADMVDSYQDFSQLLSNIVSAASAGTGLINIVSTSAVALVQTGAFGTQVLATSTTAQAQALLNITAPGTVGAQIVAANTTAQALAPLGAGTVGTTLFQAATTTQAANAIGVYSGTYQPVFTASLNITSVSAAPWLYSVNGSAVTVAGNMMTTNTSAPAGTGVLTEFFASLPVASTFAAKSNCSGIVTTEVTAQTGGVACVAADNRARINYIARSTATQDMFIQFMYRIIP